MKVAVVTVLVVGYVVAAAFALIGVDFVRGVFPGWLLVWGPAWLAHDLEFESQAYAGRRRRRDLPDLRTAAAPVVWAFACGSLMLILGTASVPSDGFSGDSAWVTGGDWIVLAMMMAIASYSLALVGRPARWVVRWNAERAERLVRTEAALATARSRVLQSQMQPHFLFNALNSVTALLREDPARAKAVLVSLKGLMERSLETSQEPMTSVRKEVAFVRDQLAIEQERFHDRLRVSFDVPEHLLNERIPAFSLQPLAENALRHGIAQSIDGGGIAVSVAKDGEDLVLVVENTGADLSPGWREGTGLGNLRARLDARYGRNADLSITQIGDRTRATIRISPEPFRPLPSSKPQEVLTQ